MTGMIPDNYCALFLRRREEVYHCIYYMHYTDYTPPSKLSRAGAVSPTAFITGAILARHFSISSLVSPVQIRGPSNTAGCTEP